MRLDKISQLLQDAQLGVEGQTLFIHQMPADCKRGILIKPPANGIKVDNTLPGYYRSTLQLIIRAQTHTDGEPFANEVMQAVTHKQTKDYLDQPGNKFAMRVNYLLADQLPLRYARLDGNGIEWSLNFITSYVLPSN